MNHESNADSYDPIQAFSCRREMYLSLQKTQKYEHDMMKCIGAKTAEKKKELLEIFSRWLLMYTQETNDHWEVQRLSGCNMHDWLKLQQEAISIESEVIKVRSEASIADTNHKSAAPLEHIRLGIVNEWFSTGDEKMRIQNLSNISAEKDSILKQKQNELNENILKRQVFGKNFFRGCLSNLQDLESSSVFGSRCKTITQDTTRFIASEWGKYLDHQQAALSIMGVNTEMLHAIYNLRSYTK